MNATMTFKEEALLAISRLPNKATARQVRERVDVLAALRESDAASAQGRTVSHAEVLRRFRSWHQK
jgi:predicted transcriptional regulator